MKKEPEALPRFRVRRPTNLVKTEETTEDEEDEGETSSYKINFPACHREFKKFTETVPCPGCGEQLPSQGRGRSYEYFKHCIKECPKYRKLGKM